MSHIANEIFIRNQSFHKTNLPKKFSSEIKVSTKLICPHTWIWFLKMTCCGHSHSQQISPNTEQGINNLTILIIPVQIPFHSACSTQALWCQIVGLCVPLQQVFSQERNLGIHHHLWQRVLLTSPAALFLSWSPPFYQSLKVKHK